MCHHPHYHFYPIFLQRSETFEKRTRLENLGHDLWHLLLMKYRAIDFHNWRGKMGEENELDILWFLSELLNDWLNYHKNIHWSIFFSKLFFMYSLNVQCWLLWFHYPVVKLYYIFSFILFYFIFFLYFLVSYLYCSAISLQVYGLKSDKWFLIIQFQIKKLFSFQHIFFLWI